MSNVHTPERQPEESMQEYRARRLKSKRIVQRARCYGLNTDKFSGVRFVQVNRQKMIDLYGMLIHGAL